MLSQSCTQDSLVGSVWAFLYQAIPEAAALVPFPPPLTELMGSWGCPITSKLAVETEAQESQSSLHFPFPGENN